MATSDPGSRAAQELFGEVRRLHVVAGEPSSRSVAQRVGGMSHTTVNQVLRGYRVPSWPVLVKIVNALDGDEDDFRVLWNAVRESGTKTEDLPSPGGSNHEVSVFVSYAHVDDKATYGRINDFVKDVANAYGSNTGKDVGLFMDTSSIAAGEDWKDRIQLGLASSSIFLAFISPAFLRSVNCVQEFWEFVHFLNANSTTRLLLPLMFADGSRLEAKFGDDPVWIEASKRQITDISAIRFSATGSPEWLERVYGIAERIEDVLDEVAATPPPEESASGKSLQTPANESLDIFGRIETLEREMPLTQAEMVQMTEHMDKFAKTIGTAGPLMNRASTTKGRIKVSRQMAKQLNPIADSMTSSAHSIRQHMMTWDESIRAIIEFSRRYPTWLSQSSGAEEGLISIQEMADAGVEAFSELDQLHDIFGQGRGLSAALDEPLRKAQDSLMILGEVRGLFVGWREGIEGLQVQ